MEDWQVCVLQQGPPVSGHTSGYFANGAKYSRPPSAQLPSSSDHPSVLVFGIDSISNSNFKRQLPHTYQLLMKKYNAIEFPNFSKIWDNTFGNLMAFFSGQYTGWSKVGNFYNFNFLKIGFLFSRNFHEISKKKCTCSMIILHNSFGTTLTRPAIAH